MATQHFPTGKLSFSYALAVDTGFDEATPSSSQREFLNHVMTCLYRHKTGDWGDVSEADAESNAQALESGEQVVSGYESKRFKRVLIITEADRSVTTILYPEDY